MYELMVRLDFSAAHRLNKYKGKCSRLHGHNWKVDLMLASARLDKGEMVMDATEVKKIGRKFLESIDHTYLNDMPYFKKKESTSENIAAFIYKRLKSDIPKLVKVRVWESDAVAIAFTGAARSK